MPAPAKIPAAPAAAPLPYLPFTRPTIDEAAFRRVWSGAARVWLVIRPEEAVKLYADPTFRYYLLEESRSHYLLSNQP